MSAPPRPGPPDSTASPRALPGLAPWPLALLAATLLSAPTVIGVALQVESLDLPRALAIGAGLLALALLLSQFLSSGRFERVSGRTGIDRTMRAHQWAGRALLLLVLAHPLLFAWPDAGEPWIGAVEGAWSLSQRASMRSGALALLALAVLVIWALLRRRLRRKLPHEVWRAAHLLLALAAATLALHHALTVGGASGGGLRWPWLAFAAIAALTVLWVHALRPALQRRRAWTVEANCEVAAGIRELTLRAAHPAPMSFAPGQFAWLDIGASPLPLRDHPFSIASAPAELPRLRLLIKARGDFTARLGSVPVGARAFLDYPHGTFTPQGRHWDRLLLVAGGIGVAPMFAILRALAVAGETRPVSLVYGANFAADLVQRAELEALRGRLVLDLHLFVDHACDDPALRPRAELLPTVARIAAEARGGALLAMICGPVGMPQAVQTVLRAQGVPRRAIVYERFDYD